MVIEILADPSAPDSKTIEKTIHILLIRHLSVFPTLRTVKGNRAIDAIGLTHLIDKLVSRQTPSQSVAKGSAEVSKFAKVAVTHHR